MGTRKNKDLIEQQEHIVQKKNLEEEKDFDYYLELGKEAIRNKDVSHASDILKKAAEFRKTGELYLLLGVVHEDLHSYEKAAEYFKKGIDIDSRNPELFVELGTLYYRMGKSDAAKFYYEEALSIRPLNFSANFNMGIICRDKLNWERALEYFKKAELVNPTNFLALYNIGFCYQQLGDSQNVAEYYRKSLHENPVSPEANFAYGNVLKEERNWERAKEYFKASLRIKPKQPNVLTNLGIVYHYLGEFGKSKELLEEVIEMEPNNLDAKVNLAANYYELGEFKKSRECYEEVLKESPDDAITHFNYSLLLFTLEEYEKALAEYEWRLKTWDNQNILKNVPFWKGENLRGKRIFVIAEQGLGDELQFVRYIKELQKNGGYVILQTRKPLLPLFAESKIADEITSDAVQNIDVDYQIHLMSIPKVVGKFPLAANEPYIIIDSETEIAELTDSEKLNIGIVWRGNIKHMYDFKRSVNLTRFKKLFVIEGARFYSLQINPTSEEKEIFEEFGVKDLSSELDSFLDTAKYVNQLDLVISVDSAVAHLAGAMGKEVWTLISKISDWRWGTGEDGTVWYKTMKLFRQEESREWERVFKRIGNKLAKKIEKEKMDSEQELALLKLYGLQSFEKGKNKEAIIYFKRYLEKAPYDAAVLLIAGTLEFQESNFDAAEKYLLKLAEINRNSVDALNMLGEIYFGKKDFNNAIEYYKRGLEIKETPEVLNNLALALQSIGRYEDAEKYLRELVRLEEKAGYYLNFANALYFLQKFDEALANFDKALELENLGSAHIGKSFAYLAQKDFKNGFLEYDWAIKEVTKVNISIPEWDGREAWGKSILIYTEQGFGDSIQFMRFLPEVKRKGLKVIVGTSAVLAEFFENSPFVDEVVLERKDEYDFSCSIMKLPKILGLEKEEDFALPENLFYCDENLYLAWKNKLSREKLNVLVMWRTVSPTPTSKQRSLNIEALQKILDNKAVKFFIVEDPNSRNSLPEDLVNFENVEIVRESLWNIASITKAMDLVISIDSSILHIAAAQNVPVWVLLPEFCDWRWTFEGETSYWYPSVKLFRQSKEGNWTDVVERISEELGAKTKSKNSASLSIEELLSRAENYISRQEFVEAEKLLSGYSETYKEEEEFNFKAGFVKQNLGKHEEALGYYGRVLQANPANLNAINNSAVALKDLGQYEDAEKLLRISSEFDSQNSSTYNNLGIIADATGRFYEAVDLFKRALSLKPEYADAEINLANTLSTLQMNDEALKVIDNLLKREPNNVRANFNKSLILLSSGNYTAGFEYYEWRRKLPDYLQRKFAMPELNGEKLEGKKILVYDEQGYGDTIQFVRFVKHLSDAGAEVILQTHGSLSGLMRRCEGVSDSIPRTSLTDDGLRYDYHIPLLSLPEYFHLGKEECGMEHPYIKSEREKVEEFASRFFRSEKIKVGLVWEGKTPLFNAHRSATIDDYSRLINLSEFEYYSLQIGDTAKRDSEKMRKLGIVDLSDAIIDFSDTAAILNNLDLLISIDTSVAHLAGALNVSTFLLLSEKADWRWGHGDRTIWYPSIKIFRQTHFGNWSDVIEKVYKEMNPRNGVQTITNNKKRS